MLTTEQIRNRTKIVTRRLGWKKLKVGEVVRACKKCMGLKKGEQVEMLSLILIIDVRREPLSNMLIIPRYGKSECIKEGFPNLTPYEFVKFFCESHNNCSPDDYVTRIQFDYI